MKNVGVDIQSVNKEFCFVYGCDLRFDGWIVVLVVSVKSNPIICNDSMNGDFLGCLRDHLT